MSRSPGTRLHVGDTAVARIAALHARRVPGVVALRPDLTQALIGLAGTVLGRPAAGRDPLSTDGVSATVDGGAAEVSVTIVTRLGHNCRDLARAVQQRVAAGVAAQTGLSVQVTVTIAEVRLD